MNIVAVVVYNRFENIEKWIKCWKQCKQDAILIIVHNYYGVEEDKVKFKKLCDKNKIKYVPRNGEGQDIGAFKDVCQEKLNGFPNDWKKLLWTTDDTFPMQNDFTEPFFSKLTGKVGVTCMQISNQFFTHIRTTGFAIGKVTAMKLKFNEIKTKEDCYQFEHRNENSFYNQITKMGLQVLQVCDINKSPLWDSGFSLSPKREDEFKAAFPERSKVLFIAPMFDAFPEIISSLICQTHKDWELLLIHDGPEDKKITNIIEAYNDKRIIYIRKERVAKWGHPLRQWALNEIKEGKFDTDYIVITNADNYHVPTYTEYLLKGFKNNTVATYCQKMVHSYLSPQQPYDHQWGVIECKLMLGYLDCAGVMVKKDVACEVGWRDTDTHSADWTYFEDIIKKYGSQSFVNVPGCLLSHN